MEVNGDNTPNNDFEGEWKPSSDSLNGKILDLIYIYLFLVIFYLKTEHEKTNIALIKDKLVRLILKNAFNNTFYFLLNIIF